MKRANPAMVPSSSSSSRTTETLLAGNLCSMPDDIPNDGEDLNFPPSFFPMDDDSELPRSFGEPVKCQIDGVFAVQQNSNISHFVLLSDGERKMPISIGPFEALSISQALEKARPDRPLTHDLLKTMVERLNGDIDRIVIDDLWNSVYYAKIYVDVGKEEVEVDSRPSDAIAIAIRFNAPIYVADGILELGDEV